jgi:hypothetical protein
MENLLILGTRMIFVPLFVLIRLSTVIGGLWLAWHSAWSAIGWGLLVAVGAPYILAFAMLPIGMLLIPAAKLLDRGNWLLAYAIISVAAILNSFVMTMYFYLIMAEFLPYAKDSNPWAILMWTLGIATSGLGYMALEERRLGGSAEGAEILTISSSLGFIFSLVFIVVYKNQPIGALLISMGTILIGSLLKLLIQLKEKKHKEKKDAIES